MSSSFTAVHSTNSSPSYFLIMSIGYWHITFQFNSLRMFQSHFLSVSLLFDQVGNHLPFFLVIIFNNYLLCRIIRQLTSVPWARTHNSEWLIKTRAGDSLSMWDSAGRKEGNVNEKWRQRVFFRFCMIDIIAAHFTTM
jgi:hypothetical protein